MKKYWLFFVLIAFFTSANIILSANKDSSQVKEEFSGEFHAGYLMESLTPNKFIGIGILNKYNLMQSRELAAIVDIDFVFGFYGAKKVNDVNFLIGLRLCPSHENFRTYYEISTGMGFVDNHDSTRGYTGNFSRLKVGLGYKIIALELSVSAFVAKDFTIAPLEGIGLAISF